MRRIALRLLAVVLVAAGVSRSASAGLINISTGLDSSNTLLTANGQLDAHWRVISPVSSGPAQAIYPGGSDWYGGWLANGPNSTWIARDASTSANGVGLYFVSFDLTGWDLSSVVISGGWAIDDEGTLQINGNVFGSLGGGAWGGLTAFSVPNGFLVSGMNTLAIQITGTDNFLEAVRLEGFVEGRLSAAPEPSTVVSAFLGAAALVGLARRRRLA